MARFPSCGYVLPRHFAQRLSHIASQPANANAGTSQLDQLLVPSPLTEPRPPDWNSRYFPCSWLRCFCGSGVSWYLFMITSASSLGNWGLDTLGAMATWPQICYSVKDQLGRRVCNTVLKFTARRVVTPIAWAFHLISV